MKLVAAVAISIPVLVAQAQRGPVLSVTAVRHWSQPEVTRVAVEVSGDFEIRSDHLHNPDRIYYDFLNARPWFRSQRIYSEIVDDVRLNRIRVAETAPGITRIVLDLAADVEASTSKLANPSRLMIELRGGAPPAIPSGPAAAPTPPVTVTSAAPPRAAAPPPTPWREDPPKLAPAALPAPLPEGPEPGAGVTAEPSKSQLAKASPPARPAPVKAAPAEAAPSVPPRTEDVGKAARHTASGGTSLVRALGLKINRVVIDPGHGGHDQGTEGPRGLLEKDIVLDIGQRLGKLIEERLGAEVIFTRSDDTFVPLEARTALANDRKADLFLSIHANSSPVSRTAGVETYYLNIKGSSRDAIDVASRENASFQKSIFELQDILQKITRQDKAAESREFAGRIQAALFAFSARNVAGARNRGVRTAPFVVLIGANMPSVLAEIGFLSNPREEALLRKADYRQKMAEALFRGVSRYADSLSHFQVAQAQAQD